ncbi:MAG: hypothetical protein HZB31_15355 [Nitrospirae bacterium]|nr:hypothetical protein [Nitrospirota bacterium]
MFNDLMKKDNELMDFGGMNPMQMMMQKMLLPQTKRISPDANIITRKLHKGRQKDFAEIARYEAEALDYQARSFNLMMDVFERMATFSDRIKLQLIEMEHQKTMMTLAEKKEQAIIMGVMLDNEIKQGTLKRMGIEEEIMRAKNDLEGELTRATIRKMDAEEEALRLKMKREDELMQAKINQLNIDNKLSELESQIKTKDMEAYMNRS